MKNKIFLDWHDAWAAYYEVQELEGRDASNDTEEMLVAWVKDNGYDIAVQRY